MVYPLSTAIPSRKDAMVRLVRQDDRLTQGSLSEDLCQALAQEHPVAGHSC